MIVVGPVLALRERMPVCVVRDVLCRFFGVRIFVGFGFVWVQVVSDLDGRSRGC